MRMMAAVAVAMRTNDADTDVIGQCCASAGSLDCLSECCLWMWSVGREVRARINKTSREKGKECAGCKTEQTSPQDAIVLSIDEIQIMSTRSTMHIGLWRMMWQMKTTMSHWIEKRKKKR